MTYEQHIQQLQQDGYTRVERDDRLLDIFTNQTVEKGIELWERWDEKNVDIAHIRIPYKQKKIRTATLSRAKLEKALQTNEAIDLSPLLKTV